MKKYSDIKNLWGLIALVVATAAVCKLNIILIGLILIVTIILIPILSKQQKIRRKNKQRFDDVVAYMEQMCYSFKKTPKIRLALIDAQKIASSQMKEILEEVIVNIDVGKNEDIYEESLKIVEEEYECKRITSLHKFIVKIEKTGGEFENYLDLLLEDIKEWADRTELFRRDVDRIRRNVAISIIATMITCAFMAYLIPEEYGYTKHPIYQITTTLLIMIMVVVYIMVYKSLNFDLLKENKTMPDLTVDRYYELVYRACMGTKQLKVSERMSYKKAKKRLENEIKKAFPDWLRETAINLQQQTVQSAIESSYNEAPYVLKRPIKQLLIDFEEYPIGIEPYDRFLDKLDLPEIKSSIKMFYCVNELGKEETYKQTNAIIDRNNKMIRQAEEMKNKDKTSIAGFLTTIPIFAGVIKIMVDMVLMIIVFTSAIGGVINGG